MNDLHKYLKIHKIATQTEMQFCTSTPNYLEKGIESVIASMIIRAKKTIKLVTPYFIPSELCASALNIAANSGINIQIITSSKPDNKKYILDVNRSQYLKFMNEHCQIYEYNGFIHSKYLIIDDEYVLITTANFDYRSF
jgi:cardiolipin synthase